MCEVPPELQRFFEPFSSVIPSLKYAFERHSSNNLIPLHACEQSVVKTAASVRQTEFLLGRSAAKKALCALWGVNPSNLVILRTPSGAPIWPDKTVGSISHTADVALAVCAQDHTCQSIGVDIERLRCVNPNIRKKIVLADEHLRDWGGSEQQALLSLFSIKESIYKTAHPLCGASFSLSDICVKPIKNQRFFCELKKLSQHERNNNSCIKVSGGYSCLNGYVVSFAYCL